MVTTFYFLRHGNTAWTDKQIYYGATDIKMDKTGRNQIRKAAFFFADKQIDLIMTSPLQRSLESASIINEQLQKNCIRAPELAEMNFGIFEGLTHTQITEKFPGEYNSWINQWITNRIPGGESLQDMADRVVSAIEKVRKEYQGKTLLLVSHGGAIRAALSCYLTGSLENYWKFSVKTGSITEVYFTDDFPVLAGLYNTKPY